MSFGVTTDYLSLADTDWQVQSAGLEQSRANAQAVDSAGDVVCETTFNGVRTWTNSYAVVGGDTAGNFSIDAKCKIGTIFSIDTSTRAVATGIEFATTGETWPMVTVTAEEYAGDTSDQATYSSGVTAAAATKTAQAYGFAADTNSRVVSASLSLSGQVARVADSEGTYVRTAVYQGRAEASGELVSCTATPGATADTANGYAFTNSVGVSEDNSSYGTATVNTFKNLSQDT